MTTEIARRDEIPSPTPQIAKSLSPQQLAEHRQAIASEVRTVLSAYFQPHEDERIKASQLAWWCDELEDWSREQIVWALRQWNRDNPRLRPTPGDIVAVLKLARGRKLATQSRQAEPERPRHDEEHRQDMIRRMAEAGNDTLAAMRERMEGKTQ